MRETFKLKAKMADRNAWGNENEARADRVFRRSYGYPAKEINEIIARCKAKYPMLELFRINRIPVPIGNNGIVTHVWWQVEWKNFDKTLGKLRKSKEKKGETK